MRQRRLNHIWSIVILQCFYSHHIHSISFCLDNSSFWWILPLVHCLLLWIPSTFFQTATKIHNKISQNFTPQSEWLIIWIFWMRELLNQNLLTNKTQKHKHISVTDGYFVFLSELSNNFLSLLQLISRNFTKLRKSELDLRSCVKFREIGCSCPTVKCRPLND